MILLEREEPLHELEAMLKEVLMGEGRMALISGEAGIGKTALINHFIRAQPTSIRTLWGACDAFFTPRPLGPLHDMAAQLKGNLPALLNAPEQHVTLFSTVLVALQSRPTLAVFEDVHWADEATLDLLKYLGRRITRTQALIVLTYREDELSPTHPLHPLLSDLGKSTSVRHLPLSSLSVEAVRMLIGTHALDASRLHIQTGGNPFFVTEAIANLASGIPPTVRDAVLARAARLSSAARTVLEAAAVIGPRIETWVLAKVTDTESSAPNECVEAGMLISHDESLTFRHELARQAILESISPTQRLALHRAILATLRGNVVTRSNLTRLVHHAEGAGDQVALLELAPAAARQAVNARAHRAAAALFKLTLQFADALPVAERAELWESYARERGHLEPRKEAVTAWRAVADLWREAGESQRYGNSLAYIAMGLNELGMRAECDQAIEAALSVLESLPPSPMLMTTYRTQALQHLFKADDAQAIALAEKALAVAQHLEDSSVVASAYEGLGLCWLGTDVRQACAFLEQSLALQREAKIAIRLATVCANLGSVYCEHFQFTDAERVLAEGITLTVENDLDRLLAYMEGWQALMWMHQGRWNEATELANQSLKRATSGQLPALMTLGRIHARRGDSTTAMEALNQALEIGTRMGNLQRLGQQRAACAEGTWLAGESALALEHARALYEVALAKRHPWLIGELAFWRWRAGDDVLPLPEWMCKPFALHIAGDWRGAATEWERLGCPYEQARALADGDPQAQVAALAIFDRLGAQPATEALRLKLRAAGILTPRGPRATTRNNSFGLTKRQAEILVLLAEGHTNVEIAGRLNLSVKTVNHHVSAILAKLNVPTRASAVEVARRQGPTRP